MARRSTHGNYAAYGIGVQILSVSFVDLGSQSRGQRSLSQYLAGDPEGARRQAGADPAAIFSMMVLSALIMPFAHELASALINEPMYRYTVIFIYILGPRSR